MEWEKVLQSIEKSKSFDQLEELKSKVYQLDANAMLAEKNLKFSIHISHLKEASKRKGKISRKAIEKVDQLQKEWLIAKQQEIFFQEKLRELELEIRQVNKSLEK